ncbi:MAG: hypothetical protein ACFFF4_19165 [Candidatus Thorarchaeota archaeon]
MSSFAPLLILSLMFAFPLVYFLLRFLIQDVKYNSLLIIGLSAISSEIVAFVWLLVVPIEDLPTRLLAGVSLAIIVVVMIDLYTTLRSMLQLNESS